VTELRTTCRYCAEAGYTGIEIKFQSKDENGKWKRPMNLDGSLHTCKQKVISMKTVEEIDREIRRKLIALGENPDA